MISKLETVRIAGTQVQGKDHIKNNKVCQDRTYHCSRNGVNVVALSDGAGSREFSHFGAEVATQVVSEYVADHFTELFQLSERKGKNDRWVDDINKIKKMILAAIMVKMEERVKNDAALTLDLLACTLLFVAVKGDTYLAGHIGDGVIGFLKSDGDVFKTEILSGPDNGDAANITFFTTDEDAVDHFHLYSGECSDLRGVILMSDGPEEVLFDARMNRLSKNVLTFFEAFHGTTTNDYLAFLNAILQKNIAEISYDDLSVNILYLDTIDITESSKDIIDEVLRETYDNQMMQMSSYCYHFDPAINPIGKAMPSSERLEWLRRRS